MLTEKDQEVYSELLTEDWMSALVYAMEERLALLASRGYPLEKHMTVYRMMLESCFDKWSISGLKEQKLIVESRKNIRY